MKQKAIITLFLLSCSLAFSQTSFEAGYFIDDQGNKTPCLIENKDWKNNPDNFNYKISDTDKVQTRGLSETLEFGIYKTVKYVKASISLDKNEKIDPALDPSNTEELPPKEIFLQVLLSGKAQLFQYTEEGLIRFFFQIDDGKIEQLTYRKYQNQDQQEVYQKIFIKQLFSKVKCDGLSQGIYERLKYSAASFKAFFKQYNSCQGTQSLTYQNKNFKNRLRIHIKPGVNWNSISLSSIPSPFRNADFGKQRNFKFGIEGEYFLRGQAKRWAIILEALYQELNSDTLALYNQWVKIGYRSFDIAPGARFYINNSDLLRAYIHGKLLFVFPLNSSFDYENSPDLEFNSTYSFQLGTGILFKNRFSIEVNYWADRLILQKYLIYTTDFNTLSLTVGIRIL